jgi:hypothetical protein
MFENTILAMNQVCSELQDAVVDGTSPEDYRKALSSRQEAEAYDRLKEMCKEIIDVLNDMRYNDPDYAEQYSLDEI